MSAYRKSARGRVIRKQWLKNTPLGKEAKKSAHLAGRYGITWKQKVQMYEAQSGLCKLCRQPLPLVSDTYCHVDHNHVTGKIRGLVHRQCNHLIGWVEKHLALVPRVFVYLEENV